jgi:flagellar biosynthesis protein FlhF
MRLERFHGRDVSEALAKVRADLGENALVLHTHSRPGGLEIVATTDAELERFSASLRSPSPPRRRARRSHIVALVGPTGSGKTTTAAKLALSDLAFGGGRVGLVSLDTYKIGAFDQIQIYADLAELPLEVLTEPGEARDALQRLATCDVIVVDTPGRAPGGTPSERGWRDVLKALEPDEVHFVLSAGVRDRVADGLRENYADLGLTHLLLTKLDEVPGEVGVGQLADRLGLPARWVTDGQIVPDDLDGAPERLLAAALALAAEPRPAYAGV